MVDPYISQFTKYLSATPASAERVGRKIAQEAGEYAFYCDFWLQLRNALFADRRGSRDGQALRDAAAGVTDSKKKNLFTAAAYNWTQLAPLWEGLEHVRLGGTSVQLGDLTVKLPRLFGERHPDGELEVLYVRCNVDKLPDRVLGGVMRSVQRAYPAAVITFVDLARLSTYTSRGIALTGYDVWLDSAGTDLARILNEGDSSAPAA